MVSGHSADVWSRQHQFRIDASVGVPPDAFSETGQDWGLPVYRWDAIRQDGYEWLRQRARRCTDLYDGFRVDHLVGFYRTYVRERDGRSVLHARRRAVADGAGRARPRHLRERGARIIAEDLGVVPDFVRESLARVQSPRVEGAALGARLAQPGQPFRRPADYPAESVAISGTHDTDTLAEWWDGADRRERQLCAEIPGLREAGCDPDAPFDARLRDALLEALFCAGSDIVIVPFQDLFGWRDRVNVPAVVNDENWTWRLPWPIDDLLTSCPKRGERAAFLRGLSRDSRRCHN